MLSVQLRLVSVLSLVAGVLNVFFATWCPDVAETWNSERKGPPTPARPVANQVSREAFARSLAAGGKQPLQPLSASEPLYKSRPSLPSAASSRFCR